MEIGIQDRKPSLSQELRTAVTASSMGMVGTKKRIRLLESDVPSLAPSGSALEVEVVKFSNLRMGDLICVQIGRSIRVRRFVKAKMTQKDTYLLTAHEYQDKKEALPRTCLMGRVRSVNHRGQTYDPAKQESFLTKLRGKLTEYGTHRPFGIFAAR